MLHPSVTYGDTVFKGMLATGKHDIERFAALCNTLGGEALGCGGGNGAIIFLERGVNIIHYRQRDIPEHPVIADMERYGCYPYTRKTKWKAEINSPFTGPTTMR